MKNIICFHLYNDYSGSPRVLAQLLDGLPERDFNIHIVTSSSRGVLTNLFDKGNISTFLYDYKFDDRLILTFLKFFFVQLLTFVYTFSFVFKKNTIFYINTILPLGPALAARLMGKRVICHCHENFQSKGRFYRVIGKWMMGLASEVICVSPYQRNLIKRKRNVHIIPNSISSSIEVEFSRVQFNERDLSKKIIMLSSLKKYKGIVEFVQLANKLKQFKFRLVINAEASEIKAFFEAEQVVLPSNLELLSRQGCLTHLYKDALLLLNLSHPDQFIETFGMTVLEALTAGIPVIVPPVGGVSEYVKDKFNGYKVSVKEESGIINKILEILDDPILYRNMSANAKVSSRVYGSETFINSIINVI